MRHTAALLCTALVCASARAGEEQDKFEEQATTRLAHQKAERGLRGVWGERAQLVRELEVAFPGKLPKEDQNNPDGKASDAQAWFELLTAGTGNAWKKSDASAAGLGPLYERCVQRLELGPVPSISKDEFFRFTKMMADVVAMQPNGGAEAPANAFDGEADKAFRILDANSDGELTGNELSAGLKADKQADANGDGRISKEEYREYFKRRIEAKAETLVSTYRANQKVMGGINWETLDRPGAGGVPAWFSKYDTDMDGQVSLFEWKQAGRMAAEFQEMDLNGDGLLTKDEYKRWVKKKAEDAAEKRREEGK
jgi:Ca2+-binding EF-hand superfamily protein